MSEGTPVMGVDAVAFAASVVHSYALRHCIWSKRVFVMELIL